MYPAQSMRNFVCDRLTAAAREIVGAFERRIEDYEAEIARQRRMLDTVFTPEPKFHRSEKDLPTKEGKVVQNQQHLGSQGEDSRLSSQITQIKDEHEEICISQEPSRQTQPSRSTPTPTPNVSEEQHRPSESNQSETIEPGEHPSISSNKDAEPQADRESSARSKAEDDLEGLSKTNDCSENKDCTAFTDGCETATGDMESNPNEEMPDVSSQSAASTEQTLEKKKNQEDITLSLDQNCTNVSHNDSDEIMQQEETITEPVPTSSSFEEETEREHAETPDGTQSRHDEASVSTGADEDQTIKGNEASAGPDERQDGSPENIKESLKDGKQASPENVEQTSHQEETTDFKPTEENQRGRPEKSGDEHGASATPTEKSPKSVLKKTDQNPATSPKKRECSPRRTEASSDPAARRRLREGKTAQSRAVETRRHQRRGGKMGPHEDAAPDSSQSADRPSNNPTAAPELSCGGGGSTDPTANRKTRKEKTSSSSKSGKKRRHSHEETTLSELPQESCCDAEKTASGEKAKATSKTKTSSSPAESSQSKASKKSSDERKSPRSKKELLQKRPNGGSSDPKQKRQKEGVPPMSRRSEAEKLQRKEKTKSRDRSDQGTSSDCAEENVENPYKCDTCGKVMSNFKNYKFHMKSHTVEKSYKCETCGKMFRESWDLNKHLVIHATEKPYKCEICGNGFNRRYNLDLHQRVHTGEKPYKCTVCAKSFSSCVNLKKHQRVHTGEKPYTCKDCGKEFADSSAFKNHQRVHTGEKPFKCTLCKRKFATRTTLKRHNRTHTGEKPYECHVCNKKFGHKSDLKGHLRLHTGEKPYECSLCEEKFSTWLKLHKHKRVHTKAAGESSSSD